MLTLKEKIEKQKEDIENKKEHLKRLEKQYLDELNNRPEIEIAELLHALFCKHNHTDGCGWYYESWDKVGYSRKKYLEKAQNLIGKGHTYDSLKKIINDFNEIKKI